MTHRILLLDADMIAYQCAFSCEVATEWEPGYWTWHCDFEEVKRAVNIQIENLMDNYEGDEYRLCLTDNGENFRKKILPTYKDNRTGIKKPLVLKAVREWMLEEMDAMVRPGLEGDDIMGILATWSKVKGEKVMVSQDKDMATVPGLWAKGTNEDIIETTEEEADINHLLQTLTGDTADGYAGCPGIGPVKARSALGVDAGTNDTIIDLWKRVSDCFTRAGLTENDALVQARVARILRASDYNFKLKEPILWNPNKI